jgi:hypothetical protein
MKKINARLIAFLILAAAIIFVVISLSSSCSPWQSITGRVVAKFPDSTRKGKIFRYHFLVKDGLMIEITSYYPNYVIDSSYTVFKAVARWF